MSGARARARRTRAAEPGTPDGARPRAGSDAPAPGPVVAVCTGHRCAGLRRLSGGQVLDDGLRSAVRATAGGVLISCPCLGRCEQGPVTVVGRHDGAAGRAPAAVPTPMVWLRESPDPAWRAALEAWVVGGAVQEAPGPGDAAPRPAVRVPGALREAVVGYSAGSPLQRLPEPPGGPAGT